MMAAASRFLISILSVICIDPARFSLSLLSPIPQGNGLRGQGAIHLSAINGSIDGSYFYVRGLSSANPLKGLGLHQEKDFAEQGLMREIQARTREGPVGGGRGRPYAPCNHLQAPCNHLQGQASINYIFLHPFAPDDRDSTEGRERYEAIGQGQSFLSSMPFGPIERHQSHWS